MIVLVVQTEYKNKVLEGILSTEEEASKYMKVIEDIPENQHKADYDLLDFLWGDPSGHVIVLYGAAPQRFKQDYRVTKNNHIISKKDWWPEAQRIYESINGKIKP